MFLKRLDVSGFKSFANKTSVTFVPGVTAVVGPNGSGKSNITEAIRWVLGEQSAKSLRGARMEDIIFSGSDAKKAVNMAEVTLTLDNSDHYLPVDFAEISVTRRVFRSGESEFQLNKQDCRLKDIIDLFMDSGLGKEAYSVIGQGKIDEILNSRAEEKRKIFEEASGVLKYKLRKEAAEKQLSESEDSLNRVEDILHELQDRLEPLAEQASVAKDYLQKKSELEEVDIALLAHDIDDAHRQWSEVKKQVEALTKDKTKLGDEITALEQDYRAHRSSLDDLEEKIEANQSERVTAGERLEKLIGRRQLLEERHKHAQSSVEELKARILQLEQQLADERGRQAAWQEKARSEQDALAKLQQALTEKQQAYQGLEQNLDELIETRKSEYIELLNRQAAMRNEHRYLTDQLNGLEAKKTRLQANTETIKKAADEAGQKKNKWNAELERLGSEGEQLRARDEQLRLRLDEEHTRYAKEKEALGKIGGYIEQAKSRKELLESLKEDYAGYYHGVKAILKNRVRLAGIHGAVAELIQVKKDYGVAIETALGASSQHVVVSDEAAGRQAIRYLRQNKAGRATFLPLSVIRPKLIAAADRHRLQQHAAYVGTGAELLTCDVRYRPIIDFLLGTVIIAKDLEGAGALAGQVGYRYRIVTLGGDVVAPGGAMTGGSVRQQAGLIGRSAEIDELGRQIKEMQEKKAQLETEFSRLKNQIAADELAAQKAHEAVLEALDRYRETETRQHEAEAEEKNALGKYQLLTRENGDVQAEQEKITARLAQLGSEAQEAEKNSHDLSQQIEQLTRSRENKAASEQALQSEITVLKVKVAEQSQVAAHQAEKAEQSAARVTELETEIDALRASIHDVHAQLDDQHNHTDELERAIEEEKQNKAGREREWTELRAMKAEQQRKLSDEEQQLAARRGELSRVSSELQEQVVVLGRLDVRLDHLLETLREDYELTIEAARKQYRLTMEVTEARKKVKLMKRAIEELGTVNLGAIEEYQTVREREQFLTAQRADLLKARETLRHVMAEMDQVVAQRFSDTFAKIRGHFQTVFRELFGGGRADLQLIQPDDLLTSGVDILAEPPGKKLQRLSLLSGGERALTAIALLFAILKVRPVPFCVLDEVEAALDDANVDRYATFLKKFSMDTQFIVVTHRHGTMERSDVLYGVTMQESGVSRLVSVKLEETEDLLTAGNG